MGLIKKMSMQFNLNKFELDSDLNSDLYLSRGVLLYFGHFIN